MLNDLLLDIIMLEVWMVDRPPKIAEVIRKFPPGCCVTSKTNRGHYHGVRYHELFEDVPEKGLVAGDCLVWITHRHDSYGYGFEVFDVSPSDLVLCSVMDDGEHVVAGAAGLFSVVTE